MNKQTLVIAIVLGALVLIAGAQAVQLFTLTEQLESGQAAVRTAPLAGAPQAPAAPGQAYAAGCGV